MRFTTFIVKYIISIADWTKTIKKIQASATVFVCTVCTFGWKFLFFFFLDKCQNGYTNICITPTRSIREGFVNHKYHIHIYGTGWVCHYKNIYGKAKMGPMQLPYTSVC